MTERMSSIQLSNWLQRADPAKTTCAAPSSPRPMLATNPNCGVVQTSPKRIVVASGVVKTRRQMPEAPAALTLSTPSP